MPDTEQEQAQELYDKLKPEAVAVYVDHIVSRTPPALQDEMKTIAAADMQPDAPEPDPTTAEVNNGQAVSVVDSTNAPVGVGTATVAGSTLTNVKLAAAGTMGQRQGPQVQRGTVPPRR